MILETSHLKIRSWEMTDAPAFLELTQDEGFRLFPITNYQQSSLGSASDWIQKSMLLNQQGLGKYAVLEKGSQKLIGMGGLTPWKLVDEELIDITYRFRQSAWGKGQGFELASELVRYGFQELKLPQITATITPDNHASKRIAQKLGMTFDQHIILLGVPTDLYRLYSV